MHKMLRAIEQSLVCVLPSSCHSGRRHLLQAG